MAYQTLHPNEHSATGIVEGLREWLATTIRNIGAFYAERGRVAQLAALDRRTLKDIGISPAEISSVAHWPNDPSRQRGI